MVGEEPRQREIPVGRVASRLIERPTLRPAPRTRAGRSGRSPRWLVGPAGAGGGGLFFLPVLTVLPEAFGDAGAGIASALSPLYLRVAGVTVMISAITTAVTLVVAYP